MFIVIFGDLIHGFTVYGPFDTRRNAQAYAELDGIVMRLKTATRASGNGDIPAVGQILKP